MSSTRALLALFLLFPTALAHSWLEQLQLISENGTYTGNPGYPRGYIARTDPGFNGYSDKYQLPSPDFDLGRTRINSTDLLCHPAQRTQNYTSTYPKLQVTPDSYVALRYLENGHVSQPWIPAGKPDGSGAVFVYGTYEPSATEKIANVLQWTADGKGGNGKGFLLTAQDFDDGRCHQPNNAPISVNRQMEFTDISPSQESWCETDLHIPASVRTGSTLTIYWIWSWQTATMTEGAVCGKDEYYTTCADVDVVDAASVKKLFAAPIVHTLLQQDPQVSAVSNYKSRTAHMSTPNLVTTEGCSYTTFTSKSLPASLTQMTSLPANFLATYTQKPPTAAAQTPVQLTTSTIASVVTAPSSAASKEVVTMTVTAVSVKTITFIPSATPALKGPANALEVLKNGLPVRRRALRFYA